MRSSFVSGRVVLHPAEYIPRWRIFPENHISLKGRYDPQRGGYYHQKGRLTFQYDGRVSYPDKFTNLHITRNQAYSLEEKNEKGYFEYKLKLIHTKDLNGRRVGPYEKALASCENALRESSKDVTCKNKRQCESMKK